MRLPVTFHGAWNSLLLMRWPRERLARPRLLSEKHHTDEPTPAPVTVLLPICSAALVRVTADNKWT